MIKKLILGSMGVNCYVVYNDQKECIVIDPGDIGKKVRNFLEENELNPLAILLTHGHFDHIGAVDYLCDYYPVPVIAHKETESLVNDPKLNLSFYNKEMTLRNKIQYAKEDMKIGEFRIHWYLLEGHCHGSSMIYFPDENAMFSGDVLFKGSVGRYDFPTSSNLQTKQSLETIKAFDFECAIYPGHGDATTLSYEKETNPFLKS